LKITGEDRFALCCPPKGQRDGPDKDLPSAWMMCDTQ
jgi:hypothetical protein